MLVKVAPGEHRHRFDDSAYAFIAQMARLPAGCQYGQPGFCAQAKAPFVPLEGHLKWWKK
jgi:hypothetical protein